MREMYASTVWSAVAGGCEPHRSSISCVVDTALPALRIRMASSARCLGPPRARVLLPLRTSTGPRTRNSKSSAGSIAPAP
jgi:hypothetical protein